MTLLEQKTTRWDGTSFTSRRAPKLFIHTGHDKAHACTGIGHAAEVLTKVLGRNVTPGQITRRTKALEGQCLGRGVRLVWVDTNKQEFPNRSPQELESSTVGLPES